MSYITYTTKDPRILAEEVRKAKERFYAKNNTTTSTTTADITTIETDTTNIASVVTSEILETISTQGFTSTLNNVSSSLSTTVNYVVSSLEPIQDANIWIWLGPLIGAIFIGGLGVFTGIKIVRSIKRKRSENRLRQSHNPESVHML